MHVISSNCSIASFKIKTDFNKKSQCRGNIWSPYAPVVVSCCVCIQVAKLPVWRLFIAVYNIFPVLSSCLVLPHQWAVSFTASTPAPLVVYFIVQFFFLFLSLGFSFLLFPVSVQSWDSTCYPISWLVQRAETCGLSGIRAAGLHDASSTLTGPKGVGHDSSRQSALETPSTSNSGRQNIQGSRDMKPVPKRRTRINMMQKDWLNGSVVQVIDGGMWKITIC